MGAALLPLGDADAIAEFCAGARLFVFSDDPAAARAAAQQIMSLWPTPMRGACDEAEARCFELAWADADEDSGTGCACATARHWHSAAELLAAIDAREDDAFAWMHEGAEWHLYRMAERAEADHA